MVRVRQAKGLTHIKLLKRKAKRLWRDAKHQKGLWHQCILTVMEEHRKKLEAEVTAKELEKQLEYKPYQCDNNGWIGD